MLLLSRTPAGCTRGDGGGGGWGRVQDEGLPHLLGGAQGGQARPDAPALPLHLAGDSGVAIDSLVENAFFGVKSFVSLSAGFFLFRIQLM